MRRACSVEGCDKPHKMRGLCHMHAERLRRTGRIDLALRPSDEDRFWGKVSQPNGADGCWIWEASKDGYGYGQFWYGGRICKAYRAAYEMFIGPVPDGLQLDHLCRVRACVNPKHLEPVTGRENQMRSPLTLIGGNSHKTHCKHGHEFTPDNTYLWRGIRYCRTCRRARNARKADTRGDLDLVGPVTPLDPAPAVVDVAPWPLDWLLDWPLDDEELAR